MTDREKLAAVEYQRKLEKAIKTLEKILKEAGEQIDVQGSWLESVIKPVLKDLKK